MNGNSHIPHECPYCWRVLYSKGALTRHIDDEHWKEEAATKEALKKSIKLGVVGTPDMGVNVVEVEK